MQQRHRNCDALPCLPLTRHTQVLSRAFRNRFLELHVGDIPDGELVTILQHRCQVRLFSSVSARAPRVCQPAGREETFFPQMIDSDSIKAVRASPLERFNLASIPDPCTVGARCAQQLAAGCRPGTESRPLARRSPPPTASSWWR